MSLFMKFDLTVLNIFSTKIMNTDVFFQVHRAAAKQQQLWPAD